MDAGERREKEKEKESAEMKHEAISEVSTVRARKLVSGGKKATKQYEFLTQTMAMN